MKNLYFIKIKEEYVEYLKNFDSKIQDNSNLKNNKPYIGILIENNNGQKYFAPLSSPKEKHLMFDKLQKENKLPIDIFLIKDSTEKTNNGFHLAKVHSSIVRINAPLIDCPTNAHTRKPLYAIIIPITPEIKTEIKETIV